MDNITERMSWAIKIIKIDRDLDKGISDVNLAKILGTDKNTLATYRNQKGLLKAEVIERLVSHYHFSPAWLFSGEGEPFPGARQKYPEVCGPPTFSETATESPTLPRTFSVKAPAASYLVPDYSDTSIDPELQAMSDIKDIFASGDPILIPAIQANLNAFKRAILREQQIAQVIEENRLLKERISKMEVGNREIETRSQSIEQQMKSMMQEMAGLKGKIVALEEQNQNLQIQDNKPKEIIKYGTDPTVNMPVPNAAVAEIDDAPEGSWGF
jgi:hypothetical protein